MRAGQPQGTQVDLAQLEETNWFKYGMSLQGKKGWYGIVENPSKDSYAKHILPLVRPVFHSVTNREIGWHIIGFRVNLISDLFKGLQRRPDEMLVVVDPNNRAVYHSDPACIGRDLTGLDYIDHAAYESAYQGSTNARINGEQRHITFARSESTGWGIVQVLSSAELNEQRGFLLRVTVIILLSSFVFVALLTIYLSSNLTQPLTNILNRTKAIASGSFDRDLSIEGDGELGTLGRAVNQMADNIRDLLNQVIDDEREKRRLELQVLQHQVNPHFLYNTLNSLKVMATIQKADGIKRMVTALGRLLVYLSRNASETITLEEEISLLNDYIYIQNMRYRGRIQLEYHLEKPEWLNCRIIRFTLQPIVENSIFHGIEPKRNAGRIDLTVSERDGRLVICVRDDGVGMTKDEIEAALNAPPDKKTRGLSGIGIRNVNERIKLVYGQEYGLTIKSSVSEYTEVYIEIPLQVSQASDPTAATALTSSLAAYAFAKIQFPERKTMFLIYVMTMAVPFQVIMIPQFILMRNLGLSDSLWALVVLQSFSPFGVFLLRQFFMSIPDELSECARIDGLSEFGIYSRIIIPLSKPALSTLAIFQFKFVWNDFLGPLIYLTSDRNKTIQLGIRKFYTQYGVEYGLIMAASVCALIPVILMYIAFQKYFIQGIATTGLKG